MVKGRSLLTTLDKKATANTGKDTISNTKLFIGFLKVVKNKRKFEIINGR